MAHRLLVGISRGHQNVFDGRTLESRQRMLRSLMVAQKQVVLELRKKLWPSA